MSNGPLDAGQRPSNGPSVETNAASPSFTREDAAIYVDGLAKTFGGGEDAVTAVDDVSFTVAPGEVVGLLGPNGAGKTTTIKSILGLVLPDAGEVRVHGIDVHANPRAAYEHVDAMLEGARNDYWRLTVRENLRYFAAIRGQNPDAVADRHEEVLDHLDLTDKADTAVRDLSRGMKQKVSLASVLAGDVSVAFLDEPTLGLDVESSLKLRSELRRLAEERGLTLVLSSHDMDVIEDVCDRVVIMNDGRVIVDDTVEDLLAGFETRGYRITARGVDDPTLADLQDHFELSDVQRSGDRVRFEVAANTETFYRLTDAMETHGLDIASVETVQPDLAEVFVEMTSGDSAGGNGGGGR
ncbi:ABC transporter ATP-binding protein [Halocalculus aciditolerans]|uniref:Daunorubicin resistance protein DrrA family ABC transporter ATP-binding protein n=1 Tax=Halocalculus aciditolerans TaxID=1383812 RepID=A0A830FNX1_9EURY|nr:ABC transporter ATP-binding protein [Halocalculus aciditolerans]GGL66049.1 daunorubicin resistance protein DrrA family ABC transporter ATP-binding protein [Halocalculus aciditolerans]